MTEVELPRLERRAVRVILLDPGDRVLLLQGRDPSMTNAPAWWFTPGGGIEDGEDPLGAVRRECWEELGFVPDAIHGPIARRQHAFAFDRHWLVQDTDYFWTRVAAFDPEPQLLSDLEQRFILGWRWWPLAELADPPETIYPADLKALVAGAV